jgi:hypothetical protein
MFQAIEVVNFGNILVHSVSYRKRGGRIFVGGGGVCRVSLHFRTIETGSLLCSGKWPSARSSFLLSTSNRRQKWRLPRFIKLAEEPMNDAAFNDVDQEAMDGSPKTEEEYTQSMLNAPCDRLLQGGRCDHRQAMRLVSRPV